jgi:tetratricopeptide (TPR) repeat protein
MKPSRLIILTIVAAVLTLIASPVLAGGIKKPTSENPEAQKLIDQAWNLDKTKAGADVYKQCYELIEKADQLDPNNHEILTELARYYWNYGDNLPKETKDQQKKLEDLYEKGMDTAEKSMDIKETVDNHYWYAVNKAASLEFSSIISQAAGFPSIYKHSQYVTDHDPEYYYGASGRLWSEILVRVPKVVVEMVGWDVQEAVDDISDSIQKEPRYLENYVYKARFVYGYFDKKDEALELCDQVLKADPSALPEEVTANKVAQDNARELWKKITGKDYPAK